MKKVFILAFLFIPFTSLLAQKKNIRINVGIQGNLPERLFNSNIPRYNGKNGGFGVHVMPQWTYSPQLKLGLNMEYSMVTEDFKTDAIGDFSIISVSPTIAYHLTKSKVSPFIGAGAGLYHVLNHTPKLNVGLRPIIGISFYDVFNLTAEYNKILADINVNPNIRGDFDNYYIGIKGSLSIGIANSK